MFWNISNHPSKSWSDRQLQAAWEMGGEIVDCPFPNVNPTMTGCQVVCLANDLIERLAPKLHPGDVAHVMGELTMTYALVLELSHRGVRCVASTTHRMASIVGNGSKFSHFEFVAFRDYTTNNFS